ncbi:pseudouridine synthase [Alkalicoccus daliensis]|uniref:Pseudouridine synthase n=1 Tax=Alkalicoccus daliensis TaxID=745820 RepID=A0A1H0H256_9BACI|nr:pseudouridine synthase [Alkalicoccus daliensis]SDO13172.1 ribosomal small subunit pseudouridine synthase A [Alkalicoccus daliensis]
MRADKLLSHLGHGSRREVKRFLRQGALVVNGETVKDPKTHVDTENQEIELFGEKVTYREYIYLLMNKPSGVISATEDAEEDTIIDILEPEDVIFAPFPVGRLDKDTTGLLLLTNDGKLAHQLTSPKRKVDKEYRVTLSEPITEEALRKLREGVLLEDGYKTKPAKAVSTESNNIIFLTIQEGKYHQVKRMMAACGNHVEELERVRMGTLYLDDDLSPGEYRELTEKEVQRLSEN